MNLLTKIIGRIDFVYINFDTTSSFSISEITSGYRPIVVISTGEGVVTKSVSENTTILDHISDRAIFIQTSFEHQDKVCFMRRSQLEQVEELAKYEHLIIGYECCEDSLMEEVETLFSTRYRDELFTPKRLFKIDELSSKVAVILFRRLLLPILFLSLTLLIVSTLSNKKYTAKINKIESELHFNRREQTKIKQLTQQKQQAIRRLNSKKALQLSHIFDEIGLRVPTKIRLTELAYNPIRTEINGRKPLLITGDRITVKGVVDKYETLSDFTEQIEVISLVEELIVRSIVADGGGFNFEIELVL